MRQFLQMAAAPPDPARHAVAPDQGRVVTKAVLRAAEQLGVTARALSTVIGVSEVSLSRMKTDDFPLAPGTKPFELAVLFVRLFRSLDAIGGDPRVARAWLVNSNAALDGRPVDRIRTITGLLDVIAYLDARRARVRQYVWHRESEVVFEARQGSPGSGEYHGCPVEPSQPVRGLE